MAQVIYRIDPHEDARWWVYFATQKQGTYGRPKTWFTDQVPVELRRKIKGRSRSQAQKLIEPDVRERMNRSMIDLTAMKYLLQTYMDHDGRRLLSEVARVTGKPMYAKTFYGYFTLLDVCPYDEQRRLFMVSARANMPRQLKITCHEIMHFQWLHYYRQYCRRQGLTEKQIQDLKEAMTVLLNERQFRKYPIAYDQGYGAHQELRTKITGLWRKKKTYQRFLDECIEATKMLIGRP